MAIYRNEIVKQAKKWLGATEGSAIHKEILRTYNNHKPLARSYKVQSYDHWCATFVSAVAIKCKATSIIPTECSCEHQINKFKKLGTWKENDSYKPQAGDIVYYDWDDSGKGDCTGWSDHVGIVESRVGNVISVIEGNYNNKVARRILKVNSRYIRGFGCPKYDGATEPKKTATTKKTNAQIAKEVIAGKWGNGDTRKKKLEAAGYNYEKVQAEVNKQLK